MSEREIIFVGSLASYYLCGNLAPLPQGINLSAQHLPASRTIRWNPFGSANDDKNRAAAEGEMCGWASANSRFDIFQFPIRLNLGTNAGNVEMGLTNKSYLMTLNQRVQGSSPCAPTPLSH